ncbi:hypothetical protein [Luteibacter sp. ME-Dv--P-043b]|uniref:hypothetical protein n=1 Tax=Luteibacter sp. ME-Dv--P-043b TaxID=3040291 RepID=UPI0031F2D789
MLSWLRNGVDGLGELRNESVDLVMLDLGLADNQLDAGALSLNFSTLEVTFQEQPVELTRREFALLRILMERHGKIVRRKLCPDVIRTVRGFGYMVPRDPI